MSNEEIENQEDTTETDIQNTEEAYTITAGTAGVISLKSGKEELVDEMKKLLASSVSFSIKAQNYHWNVTGPNFSEYHAYFGSLYEEVYASVDTTGEEIRKLGSFAPGSLIRFSELTVVGDETAIPEPLVMFSRLHGDNANILGLLMRARDIADAYKLFGTVNYLEDRIAAHEKHAWMLSSAIQR